MDIRKEFLREVGKRVRRELRRSGADGKAYLRSVARTWGKDWVLRGEIRGVRFLLGRGEGTAGWDRKTPPGEVDLYLRMRPRLSKFDEMILTQAVQVGGIGSLARALVFPSGKLLTPKDAEAAMHRLPDIEAHLQELVREGEPVLTFTMADPKSIPKAVAAILALEGNQHAA